MRFSKLSISLVTVFAGLLLFSGLSIASSDSDAASSTHASGEANWHLDFDVAEAKAQAEGKPLMLYFTGSQWCPPCKATDREIFSQQPFIDYADGNLVLMKLDFTRFGKPVASEQAGQHIRLMRKYQVEGFPTLVLLSPDGELIEKTLAYRRGGPEKYVEFLSGLLAAD
jgi:thiol:disulfide interchange protein